MSLQEYGVCFNIITIHFFKYKLIMVKKNSKDVKSSLFSPNSNKTCLFFALLI